MNPLMISDLKPHVFPSPHSYIFFRLCSYKKREYAVLHLQVNLYYSQQPGCIYSKKMCPCGHIKKACYVIKTTSMTL